jgi:DNA polymerase III subunit gamma/tau
MVSSAMNQNLNLARKWRSQNFNQIVGQDLVIKMLKNSLYLSHYFPVYLFAGQRGCGKTTTARVFACAINCQSLNAFLKDPKQAALPCLTCVSCTAMLQGNHPDFIEIDAASHTGVDNVRTIIDSSSFLPLMGNKKIYLIDEAHMLSKAAFNAFLKILEEPPMSVLFILATTDTQKIIETVRSRCFQLFFRPVTNSVLLDHLKKVCKTEKINAELDALSLIIAQTGGSVRDALNLLEQVRFASSKVTKSMVLEVLGYMDDAKALALVEILLYKKPADLFSFLHTNSLQQFSAEVIWQKLIEIMRAALWLKYGVTPGALDYISQLKKMIAPASAAQIHEILQSFYQQELSFFKTTAQHPFLEMVLLSLCKKNENNESSGSASVPFIGATQESGNITAYADINQEEEDQDSEEEEENDQPDLKSWQLFLKEIESLQDPLLNSIFKQGKCMQWDQAANTLHIEFAKDFIFFDEWLKQANSLWMPLLKKSFNSSIQCTITFCGLQTQQPEKVVESMPVVTKPTLQAKEVVTQKNNYKNSNFKTYGTNSSITKKREPVLDVSNSALWPKTSLILHYFPGSVTQIMQENGL